MIGDIHFRNAVHSTLRREGGFVDDVADPGGATNWGISLRYLRRLHDLGEFDGDMDGDLDIDAEDIRQMTREQAIQIYYEQIWTPNRYGEIWPALAAKTFDLAVNMGSRAGNRLLQRALRAGGQRVDVDGRIGPQTIGAVRWTVELETDGHVLGALRAEAAGRYLRIIEANPSLRRFERGWMRRAYDED